jgi:hypothetical protein
VVVAPVTVPPRVIVAMLPPLVIAPIDRVHHRCGRGYRMYRAEWDSVRNSADCQRSNQRRHQRQYLAHLSFPCVATNVLGHRVRFMEARWRKRGDDDRQWSSDDGCRVRGSTVAGMWSLVPRRKLWVIQGMLVGSGSPDGTANCALVTRITIKSCAAHRCAAAGLDGDTHGQEVCIGAVNDAIGSSPQ